MNEQCMARVWPTNWQDQQCSRKATVRLFSVDLCTQHAKIAERHEQRHPGHFPYYMPQPERAS